MREINLSSRRMVGKTARVAELRAVERICDIATLKVADLLITLWKEYGRRNRCCLGEHLACRAG